MVEDVWGVQSHSFNQGLSLALGVPLSSEFVVIAGRWRDADAHSQFHACTRISCCHTRAGGVVGFRSSISQLWWVIWSRSDRCSVIKINYWNSLSGTAARLLGTTSRVRPGKRVNTDRYKQIERVNVLQKWVRTAFQAKCYHKPNVRWALPQEPPTVCSQPSVAVAAVPGQLTSP